MNLSRLCAGEYLAAPIGGGGVIILWHPAAVNPGATGRTDWRLISEDRLQRLDPTRRSTRIHRDRRTGTDP